MIAAAKTVSNANPYGDPAAWSTVIDELQDFGDAFGPRRLAEAALIRQIPILIVAPPPPVSIPGVPTTPTMIAYNFSITDSSTQYALDPSGEDTYTLTENSGSPNISSIELPAESAPSYSVSYEIGATWSAPEIAQPLQTLTLPNGVSGLQVTLLDDNGVPETTASDFTFYVTFSGAGTFSGDVTTPETACFLPGTHIATPTGEVRVERLAVGDMVRTATGARRLEWIGTGCVMVTRGRRSAATPIIVRKGALADNVPHQDLHITKGHSLFFDGVLIPAEFLVNHRSIVWDDFAREVTVYHLELDAHDILLANGAPAESYRDDGNRWLFRNANSGWGLPPQEPCAGNLRIRVKGCHKGILKGRGFGKSGAGISSISRPYFPKRRMFLRM
jgi:hypothetical protein